MAKLVWVGGSSTNWSTGANWSTGSVPVVGDEVYFEDNAVNVDAGLDQSNIVLTSLNIAHTYTGLIGTTSAYLQVGASGLNIGYVNSGSKGSGSKRLKIDLVDDNNTACNVFVHKSASTAQESNKAPIRLLHGVAGSSLTVLGGHVGLATDDPDETSTMATVNLGNDSGIKVDVGPGVTLTSLNQSGGTCDLRAGATTIRVNGGTLNKRDTGDITTLEVDGGTVTVDGTTTLTTINVDAGTVYLNSTGTITNLKISGNSATVDMTQNLASRIVTNITVYEGFTLSLDRQVVTVTNGIDFVRCGPQDGTLDLGRDMNLAITDV